MGSVCAEHPYSSLGFSKYPIRLDDKFLAARRPVCRRERVVRADYVYNYVVPKELLTKLESAIAQEKDRRQPSSYFNPPQAIDESDKDREDEILASINTELPSFTRCVTVLWDARGVPWVARWLGLLKSVV